MLGAAPAALCGAGIGAVIALDLLLRRPELVAGAVLIEPPLTALVPAATEALSDDRRALERAVADGGVRAAIDLYLGGGLSALGAGTARLPAESTAAARDRPAPLFAELGAAAGWSMSLHRLALAERPSRIALGADALPLVAAAARMLAERLAASELEVSAEPGPPHLRSPAAVAERVIELTAT